jgi:hypothetical protein
MNYSNENDNYKLDGGDLVFYSDSDKQIYSGGFSVNSIMMKSGISPFTTLNDPNIQTGGNVADIFKNMVIPSWLVSREYKSSGVSKYNEDSDDEDDVVSDDLHDKLIGLVTVSDAEIKNKKKSTRRFKNKIVKNKGTKRNR